MIPFDMVWLERNDGQFWASYIVAGETLVKEGQEVAEGEVLAKAGEKGLGFRSGTNFSLWLHNRENQMVNLSKEIFKKHIHYEYFPIISVPKT